MTDGRRQHCRVLIAADGIFIGERKKQRIFGRASEVEAAHYVQYLDKLRVGRAAALAPPTARL